MDCFTFLCFAIIFFVFLYILRYYTERLRLKDLQKRAVFITGCDSGFGHDLALKCLQNTMPVFAGCLTDRGAESLRASATVQGNVPNLHIIKTDVTDELSVLQTKEVLEYKTRKFGGLHAIVNTAEIATHNFFDDFLTVKDYKRVSEVNTFGTIRVTQRLKHLVKITRGRIITMSSVFGRVGLPAFGPTTVSKFAVEGYSDVIRQELRMWGATVHILEPGFYRTNDAEEKKYTESLDEIWSRSSEYARWEYGEEFFRIARSHFSKWLQKVSSPNSDEVVDAAFHAITAVFPRRRYHIGYDSTLFFIPLSVCPSLLSDWFFSLVDRVNGLPAPAALTENALAVIV